LGGDREETTRLTHELEQREAHLEATVAELEETRQQLAARQQSEADEGSAQQAELQGRIDQLLQEKSELQQRLDRSEDNLQRLADAEAELSDTRRQLQEARHQLDQQSLAVDVAQADRVPPEVVNELREERDALEAELELVRSQAAELNETISEQQRQLDTQKTEITGEVSQLRRLFEQQAQLMTERTIARETVAVGAPAPRATETAAEDPVVTSVMAQFAKLQRDVAQRRRRKA
jgi:chromosome segregation ATPase